MRVGYLTEEQFVKRLKLTLGDNLGDVFQPLDGQLTDLSGLVYAGNAGKVVKVKATEDGWELGTVSTSVAWTDITGKPTTLSGYGITDAQPLDSDLTSIAALTTTSFGRSLLTETNAASIRTTIGVAATGADTTYAYRANNLSDLGSASTARTNLGLGTAAVQNIGTSGANVGLLNTVNTWGARQVISNTSPRFSLQDNDGGAGNVRLAYFDFLDSAGTSQSFIGHGASGNNHFSLFNPLGEIVLWTITTDPIRFKVNNADVATVTTTGIEPATDNTHYLGRNSSSSPKAWKGAIFKDQVSGAYYRLEIQSGAIVVVSL